MEACSGVNDGRVVGDDGAEFLAEDRKAAGEAFAGEAAWVEAEGEPDAGFERGEVRENVEADHASVEMGAG